MQSLSRLSQYPDVALKLPSTAPPGFAAAVLSLQSGVVCDVQLPLGFHPCPAGGFCAAGALPFVQYDWHPVSRQYPSPS